MKKIIVLLAFITIVSSHAQDSDAVKLEINTMQQALIYGDKDIAISKMYNIIALQGSESTYKDSLAYLYFNKRAFLSCFLVSKDILDRKPENMGMLEMNTISLESIGAKGKALEGYQKLLAKSNKAFHAYKLAGLQYGIKKYEDAYATIKKASGMPEEPLVTISFQVNPNYAQDVNLSASIAYLEGIIAKELKKTGEAKVAFERAIKFYPEFVLAKSELASIEESK